MDTKLKNKYKYFLIFIISICFFGISLISAFDIKNNRSFIRKEPYFNSHFFKGELLEYFDSLKTLTDETYKNNKDAENESERKNLDIYEGAKNQADSKESLRYYIKDRDSGKIYTNIKDLKNIEDYIKNNSSYVEIFPKDNRGDELQTIDNWFQKNNFQGKIIFIKTKGTFSQMKKNYIYYNSIKERLIKEIILGIITFMLAVILSIILVRKLKGNNIYIDLERKYEKVPLDVKIFIFILVNIIVTSYFSSAYFFDLRFSLKKIIMLALASIYSLYMIINIYFSLRLIRYKEISQIQLKKSIIGESVFLIGQCKGILIKEGMLFISTILFTILLIAAVIGINNNYAPLIIISSIYIIIYLMIVPLYILKRTAFINKLIKATYALSSGNLDYTIEDSLSGEYKIISKNINNMNEILKKTVDSQVKSERLKTELIASVSHDLKTPLTSIINYVNILKEGSVSDSDRKKYIDILDKKSQRLKYLIEDLFEASKVSSGSIELNIEKVDIASLLRQSLGELNQKIEESSLTFRLNIPKEPIYLSLDGKRTWRVFENLIVNAIKYSQSNSRVYIDMIDDEDKVEIIFKNISSYEMNFDAKEIFERFKRGDKARSTEGSGLGLSIAKSIVLLEKGNMKIQIDGDLFKVIVEFNKNI
ncbi:histidine kinase dimerization/phospho-acceptor domain-containing protein [Haloimpatiens sp. FM7315]|uniref:sensor histidine kinase n=1 Tax=Haloimpatiens sp. FM7315 TaxID=3298609 RepID=UPI00370A0E20